MFKNIINKLLPKKPDERRSDVPPKNAGTGISRNLQRKSPFRRPGINSAFLSESNHLVYTGANRGDFYRYMRDNIPIVSSAVWTWRRLCATPQILSIDGKDSEVSDAWNIIEDLERRIHPNTYLRGNGINRLCEDFFLELFTTGAFAGIIIPLADGSGIDYFYQLDASLIRWEDRERIRAYIENDRGEKIYLPNDTFFYSALGTDIKNPGGIEPLASIPFVVEIEQMMLEDMARSSHNAGNPRLNVKVVPPARFDSEGDNEYVERSNSYFDETVRQFRQLEADENLFTWADVEIKVIGGEPGRSYVWKLNREQVIEDVITGLKLFPWVLGRSHNATKNWVQAQFNILMQIVESVQQSGIIFADWLRTLELRMKGNLAVPHHTFEANQDPFLLDRRKAEEIHYRTVNAKFKDGYINREKVLQELGYKNTGK